VSRSARPFELEALAKIEPLNRPPNRRNDLFQHPAQVYASALTGALLYPLKAPYSPATQGKQTRLAAGGNEGGRTEAGSGCYDMLDDALLKTFAIIDPKP